MFIWTTLRDKCENIGRRHTNNHSDAQRLYISVKQPFSNLFVANGVVTCVVVWNVSGKLKCKQNVQLLLWVLSKMTTSLMLGWTLRWKLKWYLSEIWGENWEKFFLVDTEVTAELITEVTTEVKTEVKTGVKSLQHIVIMRTWLQYVYGGRVVFYEKIKGCN